MSMKCNETDHSCCNHTTSHLYDQTLDEIQFEKSLFGACVYGDIEAAKRFISKIKPENLFDEINKQDKSGYTALHYAARNGNYSLCKLLIDSKANVNAKTRNCLSTPLHRASYMCHEKIIELLLLNGANALEQDCDGKCALHKCIENKSKNYIQSAKLLLKNNQLLLEVKDKNDKTPLDYSSDLINLV